MKKILSTIRFYTLKVAYPVLKLAGQIGKPEPLVTAEFYYEVVDKIQPGDILLSKENYRLTNLFIPGFWSHAAIAIDDKYVMEAVGKGVVKTPLVKWILSKDHVMILRFKNVPSQIRAAAGIEAAKHEHEPYDYGFSSGNQAWYCAELVWYAYEQVMKPNNPFELRETMGVKTVTPQDFAEATEKLITVAVFGGEGVRS